MTGKELGKIKKISFGFGGYQEVMFGVSITLGGEGWGVGDFKGTWAERTDGCKWTLKDQAKHFSDTVIFVRDLCQQAKVQSLDKLEGIPIEAVFEDNTLKSWRILKEVL